MTRNCQGQDVFSFSQQSKEKSGWGFVIGISLLGVFLTVSAQGATFTVNSQADIVGAAPLTDGICATAYNNGVPNGVCTLRAAIMEANHAPGGPHTISVPPGLYTLTIPSAGTDSETAGALKITAGMSIIGLGASNTIIDANGAITSDRGFRVTASTAITVNIVGITIRNGAPIHGGGIQNIGGGIYNQGTLTLTATTVSGNSADFSGGIDNEGFLTLINSTVSGNNARLQIVSAGGIANEGGTLTLVNSTVSGNNAGFGGGGIYNTLSGPFGTTGGTLTLINSTVSGNKANTDGAGIWNGGTAHLFSSTVTNNQADADLNGSGTGGGIFTLTSASFTFQNTIIAGNLETAFVGKVIRSVTGECAGTITSNGNNLMENYDTGHCTVDGPLLP